MESFPLFFKIRAATFICVMLFSFLWLVLLCVEMFARWGVSDRISQSLMILFVVTNTTTLLMLPMLILVHFRIWLDTARLLLLFVLQVGSATAGTFWSPKAKCPDQTPDDIGVCQLIGVYTLIACWTIPAILVFYSTYFAIVVYLQSRIPVVAEPKPQKHRPRDPEIGSADSLPWAEARIPEAARIPEPNSDVSDPSRSLVLPAMAEARQSLPRSQRRSTFPEPPHRQLTMPYLPYTEHQPFHSIPPVAGRHRSLPASKHNDRADLRPLLPPCSSISTSSPQTPSSRSYSTPSLMNTQSQPFSFGPSPGDVPSSGRSTRHLSKMPFPSSPREMESAEPTTRSTRARLLKPVPAHFM